MTDCWSANSESGRKAIKSFKVAEKRRGDEERRERGGKGREVSREREESKQSS